MAGAMRIGDVLLAHGWVDQTTLSRALAEQRYAQMRLCSLLISRGLLDFDNATRALSEQHGVPGALSKHLDGRDPFLAERMPPALGRTSFLLPIGRTRDGKLIVACRDPRPDLAHTIEQATHENVMLAVAPAGRLEQLVLAAFGAAPEEFEVDLGTGPIAIAPKGFEAPSMEWPDAGGSQFVLADLDDARVAKDPTQHSGAHQMPKRDTPQSLPAMPRPGASTPPPGMRALSDSVPPDNAQTTPMPRISGRHTAVPMATSPVPSLAETCAKLDRATGRDEATDVVMAFLQGRFVSSLLVTINDGAALGHRGHGPNMQAIEMIALPMASPSMVKTVQESSKPTKQSPAGAIQERLARMLGEPSFPAAAPIVIGGRVVAAIVVGDPVRGKPQEAFADLDWVAESLGAAYARIVMDSRRP